jgi:hypothetical protein
LSYVNLSGAPIGEVLFWDVLAQLEAARHYFKNAGLGMAGAASKAGTEFRQESIIYKRKPVFGNESIWQIILRKIRSRKWTTSFYPFATLFVETKVIPARVAARLPRILLYPVLKLLLLLEYYVICWYTRKSEFVYYKFISPGRPVSRIGDEYCQAIADGERARSRKIISLRNIVMANRRAPTDVTEASRSELTGGL